MFTHLSWPRPTDRWRPQLVRGLSHCLGYAWEEMTDDKLLWD